MNHWPRRCGKCGGGNDNDDEGNDGIIHNYHSSRSHTVWIWNKQADREGGSKGGNKGGSKGGNEGGSEGGRGGL